MKKICVVVGTRPEIIKMAPVIWELRKQKADFFIIHSNQHYSPELDARFFEELELPAAKYNLKIASASHGNQVGQILIRIEPILVRERPDIVIVQGDTNTTMAAALASAKMRIKVAHLEAGLRSYDRSMPEEVNRVAVDHMADFLFSVTSAQTEILLGEGLPAERIFEVGNTVVDALEKFGCKLDPAALLPVFGLEAGKPYYLVTAHRSGNVDRAEKLQELIEALNALAAAHGTQMLFPLHPRTRAQLEKSGLKTDPVIRIANPLTYAEFTTLLAHASVVITDSGGVQEEACVLKTPCVTIRENTERPETVDIGANMLVGTSSEKLVAATEVMLRSGRSWESPYGLGDTAGKVISTLVGRRKVPARVVVVGLGYMGLPMACLLADAGHQVTGVDIDRSRLAGLGRGQIPFEEEGLPELLQSASDSGRLSWSAVLPAASVYLIAVPTPASGRRCDLSFVVKAFRQIVEAAPVDALVIIESTVNPGTCRDLLMPIAERSGKKLHLSYCPERAIPGRSLYEITSNDRIVGGCTPEAGERAAALYATFVRGKVYVTDSTTAECVKLLENSYRDVNIALANEFEEILRAHGAEPEACIDLANKHPRVSILKPGNGVGGHCIALDPWFLIQDIPEEKGNLITTARDINDRRPEVIAGRILLTAGPSVRKVGLLGYTYKPDVDDVRETPVRRLKTELERLGVEVRIHDPLLKARSPQMLSWDDIERWSDVLYVSTEHTVFRTYTSSRPIFYLKHLRGGFEPAVPSGLVS